MTKAKKSHVHPETPRAELIAQRRIVVTNLGIVIVILGICTYMMWFRQIALPTLVVIATTGAMGAFISSLRRAPETFQLHNDGRCANLVLILYYALTPAVIGSVCAIFLYVLFSSGLMNLDLFPKFEWIGPKDSRPGNFNGFLLNYRLASSVDYSKAIVWAFISGFSEALVPNLIGSLAEKAATDAKDEPDAVHPESAGSPKSNRGTAASEP